MAMLIGDIIIWTAVCIIFLFTPQDGTATDAEQLIQQLFRQNYKNPYVLYNYNKFTSLTGRSLRKISVITSADEVIIKYKKGDKEEVEILNYGPSLEEQSESTLRIKVASLFRRNIIRAFGYILHRRKIELDNALYTSLYFILNTIKLNQVNIINLVSTLSSLSFETSNKRFLAIFQSLEDHLPEYLRCSASFWKEAIKKGDVNMDVIFKPTANSALVVDIFQGMTEEILIKVKIPERSELPVSDLNKKILFNFNSNILNVMSHIQQEKEDINPVFLGALIEYFPRSAIQPNLEESIALVVQFLGQVNIDNWKSYLPGMPSKGTENPYEFVRYFLKQLMGNSQIPYSVKDSMQIISDNLCERNPTAIFPYFNSIAQLVQNDKVGMQVMLKYVHKGVYPMTVVVAASRVAYYLRKVYIRYLSLMTYFNPYVYTSPPEILLALLYRVMKRQSDLAGEILDSVGAVYSHVLFAYRYAAFPAVLPDDMKTIELLVWGVQSPDVDVTLNERFEVVINKVYERHDEYVQLLNGNVSVHYCSTPVRCFLELIHVQGSHQQDLLALQDILANISLGSNDMHIAHSPLYPTEEGECLLHGRSINNTCIAEIDKNSVIIPDQPKMTEGPPETPHTWEPTVPTTPSAPTPFTKKGETTIDNLLSDRTSVIEILGMLEGNETKEVTQMKIMQNVLKSDNYRVIIDNSTHLPIITAFLMALETMEEAPIDDKTFTLEFHNYVGRFIKKLRTARDIITLISTEASPTEPVIVRLIVALPVPTTEKEKAMFQVIKSVLGNRKLYEKIGPKLKTDDYRNTATLLKAVLELDADPKAGLSARQRIAVNYYINKIEEHGMGSSKIIWGTTIEEVTKKVDISKNMDNAIGFSKLSDSQKNDFNIIIQFLDNNPSVFNSWDSWVYYTKAGEFTKALFNHILRRVGVPVNVKEAIRELMKKIGKKGNASKPAH